MLPFHRPLSDAERIAWLRLIRSENVGPVTFLRLIERFGTAEAALAALPDLARRGGRVRSLRITGRAEAMRELESLARLGARAVAVCEPDYPAALAAIDDPPPVLAVRGHGHVLKRHAVAVVGARTASVNGRRFAETLARELAAAGCLVVSGLARGIDTAAHRGALAAGTAAVLPGGIDVVYPDENRALFDQIVDQGVVIAEMPPGTQPQARHFPRRNRLISGLSLGVVVIEAALRSGSLITARLALEQGREVFAVPGFPSDPRAGGANRLIKDGATLIENAGDVLAVLSSLAPPTAREPTTPTTPTPVPRPLAAAAPDESVLAEVRRTVHAGLGSGPVAVDQLIRHAAVAPALVWQVLLELDLAGRLDRLPGNRVELVAELGDAAG